MCTIYTTNRGGENYDVEQKKKKIQSITDENELFSECVRVHIVALMRGRDDDNTFYKQ